MATLELLQTGQLAGSTQLSLTGQFTQLPQEILALADSLEMLNLSNNHLTALPDEFSRLQQLKIVFFNNNQFETVPEVLSQLPQLRMVSFKSNHLKTLSATALPPTIQWLTLTNNQLESLPDSIGALTHLRKLMLAGNRLRSLPNTLANCHHLELIRLAANQLTALPDWLLTLPRLSWLAYAGNPFSPPMPQVAAPLPAIDWHQLTIGRTLGEGASGVIAEATWQFGQAEPRAVAVKLFKGEITSDGLPIDEMQACLAAGNHPNLVTVLGKLVNAPEAQHGLVFDLIPPTYRNLGLPPSLATCTRDTYPPETSFTSDQILRIAAGVAAAVAHLHRQGISHGDLYAHNILVNQPGDSLLGDFGAASFYDAADPSLGAQLERLEVRAFGCLLDDLLTHALEAETQTQVAQVEQVRSLQQDCVHPRPAQRPHFAQICAKLACIQG